MMWPLLTYHVQYGQLISEDYRNATASLKSTADSGWQRNLHFFVNSCSFPSPEECHNVIRKKKKGAG